MLPSLLDLLAGDPQTPSETLRALLGDRLSHERTVLVLAHPNLPADAPDTCELGGPGAVVHTVLADPALTASNRSALIRAAARGGALFYSGSFHPGVHLTADELTVAEDIARATTHGWPARRQMCQFLAAHPNTPEATARRAIAELVAHPAPTRVCAFAIAAGVHHHGWDLDDVVDLNCLDYATAFHRLLTAYRDTMRDQTPLALAGFFLEHVDLRQGLPEYASEVTFCLNLTSDLALAHAGVEFVEDAHARADLSESSQTPYALVTDAIVANTALPRDVRFRVARMCPTRLVRTLAATGSADLAAHLLASETSRTAVRALLANPNLDLASTRVVRDVDDLTDGHTIYAAHPSTTPAARATHIRSARDQATGDSMSERCTRTLCDILENAHGADPGATLDIDGDDLAYTGAFMQVRHISLGVIVAAVRTHPAWPLSPQSAAVALALEEGFAGSMRELLDVVHATTT